MRSIIVLLLLLSVITAALAMRNEPVPPTGNAAAHSGVRDSSPDADFSDTPLQKEAVIDSIVVIKHNREMWVFGRQSLLKKYRVSLGDEPEGHKQFQGDERTPEGIYRIDGKNPYSSCHKNLGISYPNDRDRRYARRLGRSPGGDIKIHGLPNGQGYVGKEHLRYDWTNGCIAVTDEEIDELYKHTPVGTPINILP